MRLSIESERVAELLRLSKKTLPELLKDTKFEFVNPTELSGDNIHYIVFSEGNDPNHPSTDGKIVVANADYNQIKNIVTSSPESWLENVFLLSIPLSECGDKLPYKFIQAKELAWNKNLPWKKLHPKNDEFGRPWWKKYKDITNQYITIRTMKEDGEVKLKYYDVSSLKKDDVVLLVRGLLSEAQREIKTNHESKLDKELNSFKESVAVVQYRHENDVVLDEGKLQSELKEATELYHEPGSGNIVTLTPNTSLLEEVFETKLKTKLEERLDPTETWFANVRQNKVTTEELCGIEKKEVPADVASVPLADFEVRNSSEQAIMNILEEKAIKEYSNRQNTKSYFGPTVVPNSYVEAIADKLNKKGITQSVLLGPPSVEPYPLNKVTFNGDQDTIGKAFKTFLKKAENNVGKELKEVLENSQEDLENKEEDEVLENIVAEVTISDKEKHDQEMVNHPKHYTQGTIEVSDFIIDQKLDFLAGNIVKYVCRHKFKGTPVQDLKKARWYLDKLIEVASKENK